MSEKEYIEREAAMDAILKQPPDAHYPEWYARDIREIPTADVVEVRRGEWRKENNSTYVCSCCSDRVGAFIAGTSNYCPNCGAKMDGKENEGK